MPGDHDIFISGNDEAAKTRCAICWAASAGRRSIIDLGDITTARGTEGHLLLWLRLWGVVGSGDFNIKVVR